MSKDDGHATGAGRRTLIRAALASGAAVTFAAPPRIARAQAGGDWAGVVDAANREGQVVLYSTRADADNAKLLAGFQEKYPRIQARSVRLVGGAMVARVEQELRAGALTADVLMHSEAQWSVARAREGRFAVPAGPALALWRGAEQHYNTGVITTTSEPWVVGYNTQLVQPGPTDWDSLLDRTEFRGRIGLNEVSGLTVAIWYDFLEKKKPGYLERLAPLQPRIYPNSAPLTAGLTSGEIAWAPYSLPSTIEPRIRAGAPVAYAIPSSGTWAIVRQSMMFKEAPRPNAARVLLDYMMSQDGQQLLNGGRAGFTVAPGARLQGAIEVDPAKVEIIDYGRFRDADTRAWRARVDRLFRSR